MGQSFSLTGRTDTTARLERELSAQRGTCARTDRLVTELERNLARVKKERDVLKQSETSAKALEEENAELERRIATLTEDTTTSSKTEWEDCSKRIASLREENSALRRKLVAPTNPTRAVPDGTPDRLKSMKQRIVDLESEVTRNKVTLRRVMAFAFQDFSLATYKKSWNVRDVTKSRMGDSIRCVISIDTFDYRALLRYRRKVLTIQVGDRTRTVSNAGALWDAIIGREASPETKPARKPTITDRYRATTKPSSNKPDIANRFRATESPKKLTISNRFTKQ